MSEKKVHLRIQKIKDGKREALEDYLRAHFAEDDSLEQILRDVGIHVESVFTKQIGAEEYLLFYVVADDLDKILEDWRTGDGSEIEYQHQKVNDTLVGGAEEYLQDEANLIFHVGSD